ncbi:hypothetical protein J3R30DRAFT_3337786 [Lentinula aciculospora]|uniref:Uncharacterized protein n=1 Tax=Lentinula aciculospora TaxID=153920 RepID=A0A9W9A5W4_9AGAR|nr:hypothetical protein J3R30DRAFT_3337786 [Lentinula aciculospora]
MHLCLPRFHPEIAINVALPTETTTLATTKTCPEGILYRMHPNRFQSKPWYMPEPQTFFGKIRARVNVAIGLYDELPGPQFKSDGYRLEEMGPQRYENDGHEEVLDRAGELLAGPVVGPFSRRY